MANPTVPTSESTGPARFWREFSSSTTPALGADIDLTTIEGANGRAAREVVMLAKGALRVRNADGADCSVLTQMDAGTHLPIQASAILAAQSAALVVIW
jgi:hypothetical protein